MLAKAQAVDYQCAYATWWVQRADQRLKEWRGEAVGYSEGRPNQRDYGHKRHNEDVECA